MNHVVGALLSVLLLATQVSLAGQTSPTETGPLEKELIGNWTTEGVLDGETKTISFSFVKPNLFYAKVPGDMQFLASGVYSLHGNDLEVVATDPIAREASLLFKGKIRINGYNMVIDLEGDTLWAFQQTSVLFERVK